MSKIITQKTCKVDDCEKIGTLHKNGNRYFSKGYCSKHYSRLQRHDNLYIDSPMEHRAAIIDGTTAKIPIGIKAKDGYALVDKDYSYLDKYRWHLHSAGYAQTHESSSKRHYMHHLIIGKPKQNQHVDHINRNKLDNRSENLHHVTPSANAINTDLRIDNKTGYRNIYDISKYKPSTPWKLQIQRNSKIIISRNYKNIKEAIVKRDTIINEYNDGRT